MINRIEKIVIIIFPILLGISFALTRSKSLFYLYGLISLIQIFICYDNSIRKRVFITSCLFFNTCFLGVAFRTMCEKKFDEFFYYCAMFVVAEFISSIMILITVALELFFEKIRVLFQKLIIKRE